MVFVAIMIASLLSIISDNLKIVLVVIELYLKRQRNRKDWDASNFNSCLSYVLKVDKTICMI